MGNKEQVLADFVEAVAEHATLHAQALPHTRRQAQETAWWAREAAHQAEELAKLYPLGTEEYNLWMDQSVSYAKLGSAQ